MADKLKGMKVACLVTDGVEQVELTEPKEALEKEGAEVKIVSPKEGQIRGLNHMDHGDLFDVDVKLSDTSPAEWDALFIPGGVFNADALRGSAEAVAFVRGFFDKNKPVAAICHAPWLLVEARVVAGRTVTSWPSLATDIRNAGGIWIDEEVCLDHRLVTSRKPADIPAFVSKTIDLFGRGPGRGRGADAWRRGVAQDEVEEASRESFPASDPPSWT